MTATCACAGELDTPAGETDHRIRALGEEECTDLLRNHSVGHFAFAAGGRTTVVPANYIFDGRNVVVRSGSGLVDDADMRSASLTIDEAGPDGTWGWTVLAQGTCSDVTSAIDEVSEHLRELPLRPWAPGETGHWLRLRPRRVTGRAFGRRPI